MVVSCENKQVHKCVVLKIINVEKWKHTSTGAESVWLDSRVESGKVVMEDSVPCPETFLLTGNSARILSFSSHIDWINQFHSLDDSKVIAHQHLVARWWFQPVYPVCTKKSKQVYNLSPISGSSTKKWWTQNRFDTTTYCSCVAVENDKHGFALTAEKAQMSPCRHRKEVCPNDFLLPMVNQLVVSSYNPFEKYATHQIGSWNPKVGLGWKWTKTFELPQDLSWRIRNRFMKCWSSRPTKRAVGCPQPFEVPTPSNDEGHVDPTFRRVDRHCLWKPTPKGKEGFSPAKNVNTGALKMHWLIHP